MLSPSKLSVCLVLVFVALAVPVQARPFQDGVAADWRGDYATALRIFRPLADQGAALAQYNLGVMYARQH